MSSAIAEKSRILKRISQKDGALQRHLKWLKELQENRRKLDEKRKEEEKRRSDWKKQSKMSNRPVSSITDCVTDDRETHVYAVSLPERKKPAWCQTEDAYKAAEESNELNEEVDLLRFVNKLNLEQFYEDLELQTLLCKVKERVELLQWEKKKDERMFKASCDSEDVTLTKALDKKPMVDPIAKLEWEDDNDDTHSISDSVLSSDDTTIKTVHSRKSIAALVMKSKERISRLAPIEEEEEIEVAIQAPISVTHTDDNGARMAEKKSLNKLAFRNRNPAL